MDFRHINAVFRAMAIAWLLAAGSLPALADAPAAGDARGTHANTGLRMGDNTVEGFVDFLVPLAEPGNSLFMVNPRASLLDEGESEINLGWSGATCCRAPGSRSSTTRSTRRACAPTASNRETKARVT